MSAAEWSGYRVVGGVRNGTTFVRDGALCACGVIELRERLLPKDV